MTKEEYFNLNYPELEKMDFSNSCRMIQNALWDSYEDGEIKDIQKFEFAHRICLSLYNKLKGYEEQIKNDIEELSGKHGTPIFDLESIDEIADAINDMAYICETYHKIEHIDISAPTEDNKNNKNKENETTTNISQDENPKHRNNWFVKVLDSKIPSSKTKETEKNRSIYNCLSKLYDELCVIDALDYDNKEKKIFIYRFSGLNGTFPPEMKLRWKEKQVFLGYIVRCLLSDKINAPEGLGKVALFFDSITNLSVANIIVKDYEKEKESLHPYFVKAVEVLRKCGFDNVQFTSARR